MQTIALLALAGLACGQTSSDEWSAALQSLCKQMPGMVRRQLFQSGSAMEDPQKLCQPGCYISKSCGSSSIGNCHPLSLLGNVCDKDMPSMYVISLDLINSFIHDLNEKIGPDVRSTKAPVFLKALSVPPILP